MCATLSTKAVQYSETLIIRVTKVAWKSTNFRPLSFSGDWGTYVETEGIQVKDTLYLGISTHLNHQTGDANYTTGNYVYTVDKGNW